MSTCDRHNDKVRGQLDTVVALPIVLGWPGTHDLNAQLPSPLARIGNLPSLAPIIRAIDHSSPNNIGFILSIDEFEIRSVSNTSTIGRSLFIPNDQNHATITTVSKTHKGKKMNYVCSINPMKLQQITGKITNIAGGTAFASDNGRFIAEFVIISKEN